LPGCGLDTSYFISCSLYVISSFVIQFIPESLVIPVYPAEAGARYTVVKLSVGTF